MQIDAKDFFPSNSEFELGDKTYHLRAFDIAAEIWADTKLADKEKSGLQVLNDGLQNLDPKVISKMCYYLLIDKSDFQTYDCFLKKIGSRNNIIKVLLPALAECIGVSKPIQQALSEEFNQVKKWVAVRVRIKKAVGKLFAILLPQHTGGR